MKTLIYIADKAKNIILFLGDGMSIPTLTASRIYYGSITNGTGESTKLSFDQFPHSGLSKVRIKCFLHLLNIKKEQKTHSRDNSMRLQ